MRARQVFALLRDRAGVSALEYGLMTALIAGTCLFAITSLGTGFDTTVTFIKQHL